MIDLGVAEARGGLPAGGAVRRVRSRREVGEGAWRGLVSVLLVVAIALMVLGYVAYLWLSPT